jgi:hypothetical protein
VEELLVDPAILMPFMDRLFWLAVLLVVVWLVLFVVRSIWTRAGPFLELFQTLVGWSLVAVACLWAALLMNFAFWWASHISGWAFPS